MTDNTREKTTEDNEDNNATETNRTGTESLSDGSVDPPIPEIQTKKTVSPGRRPLFRS